MQRLQEAAVRQKPSSEFLKKLRDVFGPSVRLGFSPASGRHMLMVRNDTTGQMTPMVPWATDEGDKLPLNEFAIAYVRSRLVPREDVERHEHAVDNALQEAKQKQQNSLNDDIKHILTDARPQLEGVHNYKRKAKAKPLIVPIHKEGD